MNNVPGEYCSHRNSHRMRVDGLWVSRCADGPLTVRTFTRTNHQGISTVHRWLCPHHLELWDRTHV